MESVGENTNPSLLQKLPKELVMLILGFTDLPTLSKIALTSQWGKQFIEDEIFVKLLAKHSDLTKLKRVDEVDHAEIKNSLDNIPEFSIKQFLTNSSYMLFFRTGINAINFACNHKETDLQKYLGIYNNLEDIRIQLGSASPRKNIFYILRFSKSETKIKDHMKMKEYNEVLNSTTRKYLYSLKERKITHFPPYNLHNDNSQKPCNSYK